MVGLEVLTSPQVLVGLTVEHVIVQVLLGLAGVAHEVVVVLPFEVNFSFKHFSFESKDLPSAENRLITEISNI